MWCISYFLCDVFLFLMWYILICYVMYFLFLMWCILNSHVMDFLFLMWCIFTSYVKYSYFFCDVFLISCDVFLLLMWYTSYFLCDVFLISCDVFLLLMWCTSYFLCDVFIIPCVLYLFLFISFLCIFYFLCAVFVRQIWNQGCNSLQYCCNLGIFWSLTVSMEVLQHIKKWSVDHMLKTPASIIVIFRNTNVYLLSFLYTVLITVQWMLTYG